MQLSQIPVYAIQGINSICVNFIWKSKVHKLRWDDACKPNYKGGLGIRNIEDTTKAVAVRLVWRYIKGDTSA